MTRIPKRQGLLLGIVVLALLIAWLFLFRTPEGASPEFRPVESPKLQRKRSDYPLAPSATAPDWSASSGARVEASDSVVVDSQLPPDYTSAIRSEDISPELRALLRSSYSEMLNGNHDQAAFVALEALELSKEHPELQPALYASIGLNYEKLGYVDLAIEQYTQALALNPQHRSSHEALRRLDPQFALEHPPLPKD